MTKVLTIVGMHRSGTSLLARYLHESGIYLGFDLLGKHSSNPAGHYEDREFLALHNSILSAHRLDYKVSSQVTWHFDEAKITRAKALIDARNSTTVQWGWKDPRTCLFLPFWKGLLPECHFVITHRGYAPVIRSLIARDIEMYYGKTSRLNRMKQKRFGQDEITLLCNQYLEIWIWYNSEIIRHLLEDPSSHYHYISFDQMTSGRFENLEGMSNFGFEFHKPKNFNTGLSKSQVDKEVKLIFEDELVHKATIIEERFKRIKP